MQRVNRKAKNTIGLFTICQFGIVLTIKTTENELIINQYAVILHSIIIKV